MTTKTDEPGPRKGPFSCHATAGGGQRPRRHPLGRGREAAHGLNVVNVCEVDSTDESRTIEVWADYSSSLVVNGVESELIRELFPKETAIMDAMMEVMAQ